MRQVGDGTRVLNFLVDTLIIFILAYAGYKTWNWYVLYWGYTYYNFGWFFSSSLFVYYTFFEAIWKRTPGKWISYSKVVTLQGKKPSLLRILVRSIVRLTIIDLFFIPVFGKPLHDKLSGTILVEV
jgi:uncharacterized RDD family membrane protein YckC